MKGLYDKYTVTKKQGKTDPYAEYFVLRLDKDPKARIAAYVYATLCSGDNDQLGSDLLELIYEFLEPNELAVCKAIIHSFKEL